MVLASFLILGLYFSIGVRNLLSAWPMLRRMRWLFLSILVIYMWMTPVPPMVITDSFWSPVLSGLGEGLYRVAVLVILVFAVHLLVCTTERDRFVSAIYWLTLPLAWLGLARERLALRMVLVMESLTEVRQLAEESRSRHWQGKSKLNNLSRAVSELFMSVLVQSEEKPLEMVELDLAAAPPVFQWAIPLLLILVMGSLAGIESV